jgi:RNA polymerase sigma-70 factor (ECF subfamily)
MDIVFPVLFAKEKSDQLSINNENKKMFENLLGELDIKYREILILTFWEELSYEEIGDILKIPTSTVGVRLRRAKENLLKIIDKNNLDKNLLINN